MFVTDRCTHHRRVQRINNSTWLALHVRIRSAVRIWCFSAEFQPSIRVYSPLNHVMERSGFQSEVHVTTQHCLFTVSKPFHRPPPLARYCQRSYAYIHLHSSLCAVSPSSITRRFAVRRIAETKCLARCANSGRCELNAFTGRHSWNDCIVLVWEYCSCSGVGMGWDGVRQCGGGVWNVDVYVFYTSSTDPLQFQINGCYNCFKDVAYK
jgi:hypothetical protein